MADFPEVLELNIGGKCYWVSKKTLTQEDDSLFHKMFVTKKVPAVLDSNGRFSLCVSLSPLILLGTL